jgi:serine/threonine-protein kinase
MDPFPDTPAADDDEPTGFWETDATVIGTPSSITPHHYPTGLTARELAHALQGEMLGHFLLQQFIGGGGMGVVFKALDTTLDRIVAVKVVASPHIDNDDLQRRFLIEAQSTARLDHPNIARVHYIGRDRGLPYIVFEFIDGVNLREMAAQRGPLPVGEALGYVYQIALALAHAWQRDVVHRDIKPSNILITPSGQAKLVDMGLARLRQFDQDEPDEALTATGITLGTFDYISPEQARDPRLADTRSDIYSLGCTLFFMLAGQAPFANGTAVQKLLDHQGERPPDLRSFRSDIPDSTAVLVRRMLAKAPGDRQQTPVELAAEVADILDELGLPLPQGTSHVAWSTFRRPVTQWRRYASWAAPIAALLLGAVAVDHLTRDDVLASPFPALRGSAAAASPKETDKAPAAIAEPPKLGTSGETKPASSTAEDDLRELGLESSLSLGKEWGIGRSLWDSISNWPTPDAMGGEPPIADQPGMGPDGAGAISQRPLSGPSDSAFPEDNSGRELAPMELLPGAGLPP